MKSSNRSSDSGSNDDSDYNDNKSDGEDNDDSDHDDDKGILIMIMMTI